MESGLGLASIVDVLWAPEPLPRGAGSRPHPREKVGAVHKLSPHTHFSSHYQRILSIGTCIIIIVGIIICDLLSEKGSLMLVS